MKPRVLALSLSLITCAEPAPGPPDAETSAITAEPAQAVLADGVSAVLVTVTLRDSEGRPVSGQAVELTADLDGTALQQPPPTDAAGVASGRVTSTHAGAALISARLLPSRLVIASMSVEFVAGTAARLVFLSEPSDHAAGDLFDPAVRVALADAFGNPVVSPVAVQLSSATADLSGTTGASSSKGTVVFAGLGATREGWHALTATAEGYAGATSRAFRLEHGPAARLRFMAQPSEAEVGVPTSKPFEARIEDAFGNPVPEAGALLRLGFAENPGGDAFLPPVEAGTYLGLASFDAVVFHRVATGVRLKAEAHGLEAGVTEPIDVLPGVARGLGFDGALADVVAGAVMPAVRVVARDAFGNTATAFSGTVAVSTGLSQIGMQLEGTVARKAVAGVAVFDDLVLTKARLGYVIKALGQGLENGASTPFAVVPAPPAGLVFLDGGPAYGCAMKPFTPPVRVGSVDAFGNAADEAVEVTLTAGGTPDVALLGDVVIEAVHGVARFQNVLVDSTGAGLVLSASAPNLVSADSAPFDAFDCVVVKGFASFDAVPSYGKGLVYSEAVAKPIRGAEVSLVQADSEAVIAEGVTNEKGKYALAFPPGPTAARLRVYSRTEWPKVRVQDNTSGGALYVLESEPLTTAEGGVDVHAASGWTGEGYGEPRAAAPFSVLDTAYLASQTILSVRDVNLPEVRLNWSVKNRPESGDLSKGQIESTHYNPFEDAIYLMGKADVQTDEYDVHSIVHEWTHWLEANMGRSDSFGGVHWLGAQVEARLAFGEGIADAFPGMILYPKSKYTMTFGKGQADGWSFDIEKNLDGDPHPGWFSELSVARIIYDLFDPDDDASDTVHLGIGPIYDAMTGAHAETEALTTIFSFVHAFKLAYPSAKPALNALTAEHQISPVLDDFGSGELNDGEWAENLPVYREAVINGAPIELWMAGKPPPQFIYTTRFIRFHGNGGGVTIQAAAEVDADVFVFRKGALLAHTQNTGNNTAKVQTEKDVTYIIVVRGVQNGQPPYPVLLEVTSP